MRFMLGILTALAFSSMSESAELEPRLSFADLAGLVKERNENFAAARVIVEAQAERTGHLRRSFLPQASAKLGEEYFRAGPDASRRQRYWEVEALVNVYRGGRDKIDEEIRHVQVDIAKIDAAREFAQELRRAQIAFWEVVATDKLIALRFDELKSNQTNVNSSKRRAGAGIATTADSIQFEVHRSQLEQEVKQLELKQDLNRNRLAVVLGLKNHKNVRVQGEFPQVVQGLRPIERTAEQLDFVALQKRQRVDELRSRLASRWWQPRLDLYANYGVPALSDETERAIRMEREVAAGLRLSIDFGQGANDLYESKARGLDAKSSGLRAAYKAREVAALEHELRHDLELTESILNENEKNIRKVRDFLRITLAEYARGLKNGPDLLAAFRQYYELQERAIVLNRDLLLARADLDSLTFDESLN